MSEVEQSSGEDDVGGADAATVISSSFASSSSSKPPPSTQEEALQERASAVDDTYAKRLQPDGTIKVHAKWAGQKKVLYFHPDTGIDSMLQAFKDKSLVTGQGGGISFPEQAQAKTQRGILSGTATLAQTFLTPGGVDFVFPSEIPTLNVFGVVSDKPRKRRRTVQAGQN